MADLILTLGAMLQIDESPNVQNPDTDPAPPPDAKVEDYADNDIATGDVPADIVTLFETFEVVDDNDLTNIAFSGWDGDGTDDGPTDNHFITVTNGEDVTSLSFTLGSGNGTDSGLTSGGVPIYMYLVNGVVVGRLGMDDGQGGFTADPTGDAVFAIKLVEVTSGGVIVGAEAYSALYEYPIDHDSPADEFDDVLSLVAGSLFVTAHEDIQLSAAGAPSGQQLFIMFGDPALNVGVVVTSTTVADESGPASWNSGGTVNTSAAGGDTTFGESNQLINNGGGLYFSFVSDPVGNFTTPNLDSGEAKLESSIQYGDSFDAGGANFTLVQFQGGGGPAEVTITALLSEHDDTTKGDDFLDTLDHIDATSPDADVDLTSLSVFNPGGPKANDPEAIDFTVTAADIIADWDGGSGDGVVWIDQNGDITTILANRVYTVTADDPSDASGPWTVTGVEVGSTIGYTTDGDHNRVLIENTGDASGPNKTVDFDIGGFQLTSTNDVPLDVSPLVKFADDGPSPGAQADVIIEEDDLDPSNSPGTILLPPTSSTGNDEDGSATEYTKSIDLSPLVDPGVDTPASFQLDESSDFSALLSQAIKSKGELLSYEIVTVDPDSTPDSGDEFQRLIGFVNNDGDVETPDVYDAGTDRAVFVFDIDGTTGRFTLLDQVDHPPAGAVLINDRDGDGATNPPDPDPADDSDPAGENGLTIELDSVILAFDSEGDQLQQNVDVNILIADDIPEAVASPTAVTPTVYEDRLNAAEDIADINDTLALPGAAVIDRDDSSTGIADDGEAADADEATGAAGSLTALFTSGADEDLTISLKAGNVTGDLDELFSKGQQLSFWVDQTAGAGTTTDLTDDQWTLYGFVEGGGTAGEFDNSADRLVISVEVNADGSFVVDLDDQLDHVDGSGDSGTALKTIGGTGSVSSFDVSPILTATDFDKDSVTGAATGAFAITINNDVPVDTTATSTGTVEEEHNLAGGIEDTLGGSVIGIVSYTDDDTGADSGVTTHIATGSLSGLATVGADEDLTYSIGSTSGLPTTLTSNGDAITYSVDGAKTVLTATADQGGANPRTIFTFTIAGLGWTFNLAGTIDHDSAGEDVELVDLSSAIDATDYDKDTITLGAGSVVVGVIDDVPVVSFDDLVGTGTFEPQIGYWDGGNAPAAGADGEKSLTLALDAIQISGPIVVVDSSFTSAGGGTYNGTIVADLDGDAVNDTLNFELTVKSDGTYVFDLLGGFSSTTVFDTSQGSLPAGGPDPVQTLAFPPAGPDNDITFFALNPTASPNDVKNALAYIESELELGDNDDTTNLFPFIKADELMNVSTSGVGVNNNNTDGANDVGEVAAFGGTSITSGDESFVVNPDVPVNKVRVFIDNSVGSYNPATEDLYYFIYPVTGSPTGPIRVTSSDLTPVTSGVAAGGFSFEIALPDDSLIDAVQLTMGKGKIKIPVIEFEVENSLILPDISLDLTATRTDNDSNDLDVATSSFSIDLKSDPDPLNDTFPLDGSDFIGEANSFNVDLGEGDNWNVTSFDDGLDTLVLINPRGPVTGIGTASLSDGSSTVAVDDTISGSELAIYYGEVETDTITVGAGAGTAGNDAFIANGNATVNTGDGTGEDSFVFFEPDDGVLSVSNFTSGEDQILVSASGFGGGLVPGTLDADLLDSPAAAGVNTRFILDAGGNLYFDADGTGAEAQQQLASGVGGLTASDILVIG